MMGLYNVVEPCMVGNLHYARPTTEPIEVDDDVAKPLVKAGNLTPAGIEGHTGDVIDGITRQVALAGQQAGQEFAEGVAATQEVGIDGGQAAEKRPRPRRPHASEG